MSNQTAADILRGTGDDAVKLKELVGSKFTVLDFEVKNSKKYKSDFVLIDAMNDEGEEFTVMGGEHLISKLQKLEKKGFLPLEVVAVSFETEQGTGYGIDVPED